MPENFSDLPRVVRRLSIKLESAPRPLDYLLTVVSPIPHQLTTFSSSPSGPPYSLPSHHSSPASPRDCIVSLSLWSPILSQGFQNLACDMMGKEAAKGPQLAREEEGYRWESTTATQSQRGTEQAGGTVRK